MTVKLRYTNIYRFIWHHKVRHYLIIRYFDCADIKLVNETNTNIYPNVQLDLLVSSESAIFTGCFYRHCSKHSVPEIRRNSKSFVVSFVVMMHVVSLRQTTSRFMKKNLCSKRVYFDLNYLMYMLKNNFVSVK